MLWLIGNHIHALTGAPFAGLTKLSFIQLSDNELRELAPDAFAGLSSLRYLGLQNNKLRTLPEHVFDGLSTLAYLTISANQFTTLPPNAFADLAALDRLWLSQNHLEELSPSLFSSLSSLTELRLSYNQLTELPDSIFSGLSSLTTLTLARNPGAPFSLGLRFQRIDQDDYSAPGPAVIRLAIDKGAPFPMPIPIEATGGELSSDTVLISAGDAVSFDVTVTRGDSSQAGTIVSAHLPHIPEAIQGITLSLPDPIRLFTPTQRLVNLASSNSTGAEGDTVNLTVEVTSPPDSTLHFIYTIHSDPDGASSDADPEDYADNTGGLVTFASGDSSAAIQIFILDDDDIEPARETFVVTLAPPGEATGYSLGHLPSATVVIHEGVCDRTPQVRDALARNLPNCTSPDDQYLSGVRGLNLDPTRALTIHDGKEGRFGPMYRQHLPACVAPVDSVDSLRPVYGFPVVRCSNRIDPPQHPAVNSPEFLGHSTGSEALTALRVHDFHGLSRLRYLSLRRNRLSTLPEDVFLGLDSLEQLILEGNQFANLHPDLLAPLDNLEWLNLANNKLDDITSGLFATVQGLRYLNLYGNGLDRLRADAFSDLLNLEFLSLRNNTITNMPEGIFTDMRRLRHLNLGENRLSDLPSGLLRGLRELTNLYLHENRLTRLPQSIFNDLENLELLTLGDNALDSLTNDVFNNLKKLRGLWLYRNNLEVLPTGLFASQSDLVALWLYSNPLRVLPQGAFDGLPKVEILGLHDNDLVELPPSAPFRALASLRILRLEYNQITELIGDSFDGLVNLQHLDIRGNRITSVPPNLFFGLSSLYSLDLRANPGSPFMLTLEAERVDSEDLGSPSPAQVVVVLAQGAPYRMTVPIAAQNGTVSNGEALLEGGRARGPEIVVTQAADGNTQVTVGPAPVPPAAIKGIRVRSGDPLVLFDTASNRSPVAEREIPGVRVQVGRDGLTFSASGYMRDPDGDTLEYAIVSADSSVASSTVDGDQVTISAVAAGTTRLTLTATDTGGLRAESSFPVTVRSPSPGSFDIDLILSGTLSEYQEEAFRRAAEYWMRILRDWDNPDIELGMDFELGCGNVTAHQRIGTLDDLVIVANVHTTEEDFLAQAGICGIHDGIPFMGAIEVNAERMEWMEHNGHLEEMMLHEIGHVLGIGTLWRQSGLLRNPSQATDSLVDTHFAGPLAIAAFDDAGGTDYDGAKVPVQRRRLGTAGDSHWRESVLGHELLTPILYPNTVNPLSAITIQSLADLGYTVDATLAQHYQLPEASETQADRDVARMADLSDDVFVSPVMVVDRRGRVIRVILR